MAIGVRILSDDLSGQTANVTYLPDTGGTIDLGSQIFPFNYISDYYYGTYNCYVPLYGYTYSLSVPGPTPSPTPTMTPTPTNTPGLSPSPTSTETPTPTTTETPTITPTNTSTPTPSVTIGLTPTATASNTPTPSVTPSITPTNTVTPSISPSQTETPTVTPSVTSTPSVTPSVTTTSTTTPTVTPTQTITPSNSLCKTYLLFGGTINQTSFVGTDCDGFPIDLFLDVLDTLILCGRNIVVADGDGSVTYLGGCPLPTPTATPTNTLTPTNTASVTPTNTSTPTNTASVTPTNTETPTPTNTETPTNTPSETPTNTPTTSETPTVTPTLTQTPTNTATPTVTPTIDRVSFTVYSGVTINDSCGEVNPSVTIYGNNPQFDLCTEFWNVISGFATIDMSGYYQNGNYSVQLDYFGVPIGLGSICPTQTPTPTNTQTPTNTPSITPTNTETPTNTPTNTETLTNTPTNTETPTNTPTATPTISLTPTNTPTTSLTPSVTPTNLGNVRFYGAIDQAYSPVSATLWYSINTNPYDNTQPYPTGYTWTQVGDITTLPQCDSESFIGSIDATVGNLYVQIRTSDGTQIYNISSGFALGFGPDPCTSSLGTEFTTSFGVGGGTTYLKYKITDPTNVVAAP